MEYKDLMKKVLKYNKNSDTELLKKAYNFSDNLLKNKLRASGEPWINHYLDVAYEIADLKLDDKTLAAGLMHGAINKGANIKDIKNLFGDEILEIIQNMDRMSEIKRNVSKTADSEDLKKVLLAASKDLRALLIKIADKLVNLRDLKYLDDLERKRIAKEAMEIYAPLAYRLGIGKIKSQLEDIAFKNLDEETYRKIESKVEGIRKYGEKAIFKIKKVLEKALNNEGINAIVQARIKHIYSIYKKTIEHTKLEDIRDIIALRIIVDDLDDCYKALRIVHENFRPIPGRFKDYIAMPKPNGYQSLHTSVANDEGKIFEIQIRTGEMHDVSEEGIAAHFVYKRSGSENISENNDKFDKKLIWLKNLVENKGSGTNLDVDFFGESLFAFTPKGKAIELPKNSTVIDFAYYVHSDVGDHCMGAKVNGKFVSLKGNIGNGDIVEIITSKVQFPSREWLKVAKTAKARSKIRFCLRGRGKVTAGNYVNLEEVKKEIGENLIFFEGDKKLKIKLALCCKPLPGDKVIGIKSSNVKLMIHKNDCDDLIKTAKKKVKVEWINKFAKPIEIIVSAKDRPGLLKEVLNHVSRMGINFTKARGKATNKDEVEFSFVSDVGDLETLKDLINRITKIKNVNKVYVNIV